MYGPFSLAYKYFQYLYRASNRKGHGVHSPFVYDFIRKVLMDQRKFYAFEAIESCRNKMRTDQRLLQIEDFGAGSRLKKTNQRKVSEIAHSSLKPKKFGQLLFRIVNYYQPQQIVELGTSLGITSAYLAAANESARVQTMEGSSEIAAIAAKNFETLGLKNLTICVGNFDDQLPPYLSQNQQIDLAFIDGNHRYEPTLRYFKSMLPKTHENSILIFDDIHWSKEMEAAWKEIQQDPAVTLSIDLFFIGLVFFRKENKVKQHFVLRF